MAKIVPFRGIRFDPTRVGDLAKVVAPPYDVISPALQEELHRRDPHNIIRLILGKIFPEDNDQNNRYSRAAAEFARWQAEGTLRRDAEPSMYLYDQEFSPDGEETLVRHGVIALSRIEDFSTGLVKPHEKTLPDPKADRYRLTRACGANLSPVFALYSDPCCVLEVLGKSERSRTPDLEVCDDDGVRHRLWRTTDPALLGKVQAVLDNKPLVIADGHHRYEAAVAYRNFMREQHPDFTGKELFNYVLMCFSNMEDRGMRVYSTHRVICNLPDLDRAALLAELENYFTLAAEEIDPASPEDHRRVLRRLAELGREAHAFALVDGSRQVFYLTLKEGALSEELFEEHIPKVLRTLDVSILHRLVLGKILHLSPEDLENSSRIRYVKGSDAPFRLLEQKEAQLAFLLNPTRVGEVRDVANAGEKMPQKSTYFYPKVFSGLVINKIDEGESIP